MAKRYTEKEKLLRDVLRNKTCKLKLERWFKDAGLIPREVEVMRKFYLLGESRDSIGSDLYCSRATVSRIISKSTKKIQDYLDYTGINVTQS